MWSHALARGLLRDEAMRSLRERDGYSALMPPAQHQRRSTPPFVPARELAWRSIMSAAARLRNASTPERHERIASALQLGGEQRVLDVACGSGQVTDWIAAQLYGVGFAVGVDPRESFIRKAARKSGCSRAVYLLADIRTLAFDDGAFDVVCCLTGLHLIAEPMATLHEMIRVLAPGGRIAVEARYRPHSVRHKLFDVAAAICGLRTFDRTTIPSFFAAAGLGEIDQDLHGISQFVTARRCPHGPLEPRALRQPPTR
jgi:SAM-dependent methyltransferase